MNETCPNCGARPVGYSNDPPSWKRWGCNSHTNAAGQFCMTGICANASFVRRINQLTAERDQWRERAEKAEAECEELRQSEQDWWLTFGIQRSAEMRGIRMWQKETGKKLTLPDTARFVVWLLNKLDAAGLLEEVAEAALTASAGSQP